MKRKAIVAGMFYPANKTELENMISKFMERAEKKQNSSRFLGSIVPHAGYVYSGQCAAYGFNVLRSRDIDNIFIIAPSHKMGDFSFSVGDFSSYETPLGDVKVNSIIVKKLLDDPEFTFIEAAHNYEHSIEVQLPFIKKYFPNAQIIPILFGAQSFYNAEYLAEKLFDFFSNVKDNTALIVSSDLSHYHTSEVAELMDSKMIEKIKEQNPEKLYEMASNREVEACGLGGVISLLLLSRKIDGSNLELLDYTHSGITAGSMDSVVGYLSAGLALEEKEKNNEYS